MSIAQDPIFMWLHQFAYQPEVVYSAVIVMMLASAFGLPIPEEVTLISVGLIAYMGSHPSPDFQPPYPGATGVNPHTAALVCFLSVVVADFLIYAIGRKWGRKMLKSPRFQKMFSEEVLGKVERWTHKYGSFAVFLFRFTPGVRFLGHIASGMLHFSIVRFVLIDGFAALISVPTQIYLVSHFGESILSGLKKFKIVIFAIIGLILLYLLAKKIKEKYFTNKRGTI